MSRRVAISATALLFFSFARPTSAQFSGNSALIVNPDSPQEQTWRTTTNPAGQSRILSVDSAVDSFEYHVGPGSVFSVTIGSEISTELSIAFSGAPSLPGVGLLQDGGRSQAEVEQEAIALRESRISNAPVPFLSSVPEVFAPTSRAQSPELDIILCFPSPMPVPGENAIIL